MFCILPSMFILVLQQSRLLQVVRLLTFDWSKLCRSHTIHRIYITCCKTSLPWRGKTCNTYRFCFKKKTFFCFCNNFCNLQRPNLLKDKFDSWVLKCTKSLFGSFSAMLQNKLHVFVALFTVP